MLLANANENPLVQNIFLKSKKVLTSLLISFIDLYEISGTWTWNESFFLLHLIYLWYPYVNSGIKLRSTKFSVISIFTLEQVGDLA